MEHLTDKQIPFLTDDSTLTPYHWQRSMAALQEAEEMLKHPYSYEQALEQVRKGEEMRRREQEELNRSNSLKPTQNMPVSG
ncbi:hypothetical protein [Niabella ginsenosidivorans]|uniref:hypothetical protein n=1 Tax=Niabella ginsenosidivorans TaxID=1176587 RepID=UPI0012EEAF94|nr:hypothetical protein [Niabella ginsenosidivorans]